MSLFKLHTPFPPAGSQPEAIKQLVAGRPGKSTLLGVTGSGKTYTIANVIAQQNKPVLILAPNKTLAAQLYEEFSQFAKEIFQSTYTEGLLYGNINQQEASKLWSELRMELGSKPFVMQNHPKKQVLLLSEKFGPYKLVQSTDRQGSGDRRRLAGVVCSGVWDDGGRVQACVG